MRQPSIAILCPHQPGSGFGGAEQHLADLAIVLQSLQADVSFLSREAAGSDSIIERITGRAFPLLRSPLASRRLRGRDAISRADLLLSIELMGIGIEHPKHLHLFFGSYAAFRNDALPPSAGIRKFTASTITSIAAALERSTQGSLGAIANSFGLRDALRSHGIPVRDEILLPPTNTSRFRLGSKKEARRQLGLPEGGVVLLFAGRWEYAKGADRVEKLIACMPTDWIIILSCPSSSTWPWPEDPRVIRVLDTKNEDMPWLYQAADVFVQPSRFEGYSLVVSEAQACGCPVTTSDVGHARHLAAGGDLVSLGVVRDADSPCQWMHTLQLMLQAVKDGRRADLAARGFAEATVSHKAVALQWAAFATKILPEFEWHPRLAS